MRFTAIVCRLSRQNIVHVRLPMPKIPVCKRHPFRQPFKKQTNKQINQIRFPKIMKYFLKVLIYDRDRVSNKIRKKYFLYQTSFCFSAISATHQQIFAKALYSLRVTFIFC